MTFKEDFKPTKVYNKLVNDVCYNADCLEEFEKQRLVVANPFSYNKSTRTGIVAEFDNGYHLSKEVGIKRNFVTIGMRVWDIIRKNRYAVIISFIGYIAENIKFNSNVIYISHDLIKGYGLVKPNYRDYYNLYHLFHFYRHLYYYQSQSILLASTSSALIISVSLFSLFALSTLFSLSSYK